MKLAPTLLLSTSVALFIIGVHQTFTVGVLESYWIFMLCVGFLLLYKVKKDKPVSPSPQSTTSAKPGPASKAERSLTKASTKSPAGVKKPDKSSAKPGGVTKPSASSHQTRK
ncbi:MAG: hypothetical protein V4714_05960 [Bacteroidota bacterium]